MEIEEIGKITYTKVQVTSPDYCDPVLVGDIKNAIEVMKNEIRENTSFGETINIVSFKIVAVFEVKN